VVGLSERELASHFPIRGEVLDVDYLDYHRRSPSMTMHNPPHPGEVIRELCLEPLGVSVSEAAKSLGVTHKALSELLNGKSGVSPSTALRLAIAFDTSPESWLNMQQQDDLYHARKNPALRRVRRLKAA
jgi:antitoxin HigA-1